MSRSPGRTTRPVAGCSFDRAHRTTRNRLVIWLPFTWSWAPTLSLSLSSSSTRDHHGVAASAATMQRCGLLQRSRCCSAGTRARARHPLVLQPAPCFAGVSDAICWNQESPVMEVYHTATGARITLHFFPGTRFVNCWNQ